MNGHCNISASGLRLMDTDMADPVLDDAIDMSSVWIDLADLVCEDRVSDGTLSDAVELSRKLDAMVPATDRAPEEAMLLSRYL